LLLQAMLTRYRAPAAWLHRQRGRRRLVEGPAPLRRRAPGSTGRQPLLRLLPQERYVWPHSCRHMAHVDFV
jgi:hypothetical protein